MENLEEMDRFLDAYFTKFKTFTKMKTLVNLNRPITKVEIKSVIMSLSTKKSPGLDGFAAEFYQILRKH